MTEAVITDRSRRDRGYRTIGGGMVLGAVGAVAVAGFTAMAIGAPHPWFLLVAVFPGLFVLGGAAAVGVGLHHLRLSRALGYPTLVLPHGASLYLGGAVVARFHRSGGTRPVRHGARLSAALVCEERVTYRQGTDDHTVTREIHRRELDVRTGDEPGRVAGEVVIPVPVDVPPTIALPHNEVAWSVRVRVATPDLADDTGTFAVVLLPAVAAEVPR